MSKSEAINLRLNGGRDVNARVCGVWVGETAIGRGRGGVLLFVAGAVCAHLIKPAWEKTETKKHVERYVADEIDRAAGAFARLAYDLKCSKHEDLVLTRTRTADRNLGECVIIDMENYRQKHSSPNVDPTQKMNTGMRCQMAAIAS